MALICSAGAAFAARPGWAATRPPLHDAASANLCEAPIHAAEAAYQLPKQLLHTIALVESGRDDPKSGHFAPWPWTINAGGVAHYYASKAEAVEAANILLALGVKSFDVGCLQINMEYHPHAFASLEDAFDPLRNARYAAEFLHGLYRSHGTWPEAAMSYHSQNPQFGTVYVAKVMALWPQAPQQAAQQAAKAAASAPGDDQAGDGDGAVADSQATPALAAWLKQNAEDVARIEAEHGAEHGMAAGADR